MVINGMNGVGGAGMQAGAIGKGQAEDAVSKRLQQQIDDAQKKLQEISANSDMSTEEKMKMRQEIQKEIADLNSQLRQHQIELRKKETEEAKKRQAENASAAEQPSRSQKGKNDAADVQISAEGMQAMISADGAMKQAKVQGSVANAMEGRANVLEIEIQLDGARGGDTSAKEAQLADARQTAQEATASQMSTLAEARETSAEANKSSADTAGTKKDDVKETEKKEQEEKESAVSGSENKDDSSEEGNAASGVSYAPVDVRL